MMKVSPIELSDRYAGVIGLQTALFLLEAGLQVTIVSKHWPGDKHIEYTSPWAGAQWRSNLELNDHKHQDWDRQTFEYWMKKKWHQSPDQTVLQLWGRHGLIEATDECWEFRDHPTPQAKSPQTEIWWSSLVPSFRILSQSDLPPGAGFVAGIAYETFSISPTLYLQHLLSLCIDLGATKCPAEVASLADIFIIPLCKLATGVVNCTGLSARSLVNDEAVIPTKGQTMMVKGRADHIAARPGEGAENLVVPRPGSDETLLGGCKLPGDWSTNSDPAITETILDRCRPLAPELLDGSGQFQVLALQVGHRPTRKGGVRVALEWLNAVGGKRFVCHNYGHGSSGYENSVGTANDAVRLVLDAIDMNN